MAGFFYASRALVLTQQPTRPEAEPVPHPEPGFTTGEPEIFGTWGRAAAFGLAGLTAPGMPPRFAAGFPVVPRGALGAGLAGASPGGFVWAALGDEVAKVAATANKATSVVGANGLAWDMRWLRRTK